MDIKDFGVTEEGLQTNLYTLKNQNGVEVCVSDYGATWVKAVVPDRDGVKRDVVLGYDDVTGYEKGDAAFGAIVGRIANRVAGAQFRLNGKSYLLVKNDGENNLHSGPDVYQKRMWTVQEADDSHVVFTLTSPDGDQGYPGMIHIRVTYTLSEENELRIDYHTEATEDTVWNMTNHSYFNLNGHDSGDILSHQVWVDADTFTRADAHSIPTGELIEVGGTPMDFREKKPVGKDIDVPYEALVLGQGYDHNWVLNGSGYRKVAEMTAQGSGITMEVYTDRPGVQIYTANFLDKEPGKNGAVYQRRQGICFETQAFPDAVNQEAFEAPVIRAGESLDTSTCYRFTR